MNVPLIGEGSLGESEEVQQQASKSSSGHLRRHSAATPRRNGDLKSTAFAVVLAPILRAALLVFCSALLGSCTPFAGYVSDHWPTWAGGMPKDVPPRPGAPGYDDFLAHQKGQDAAVASPPGDPAAHATSAVAASSNVGGRTPPANQPADNASVIQGGLY
jgi:hypothetical protein